MPTSKRSPWSEEITPEGEVRIIMNKGLILSGARVRYVGPPRSGVPEGRMGTLLSEDPEGIAMVSWEPYEGTDCQVTHSGCAMVDLEEVTSIPRCERPTRPGMYLMAKPGGVPDLAFVTKVHLGLRINYSISGHSLDAIDADTHWWGPIEAK